jgi:RNA polymerase sigma-70 factor, ECF subfamily
VSQERLKTLAFDEEKHGCFSHVQVHRVVKVMARYKLHLPPPFEDIMQRHEKEIMRYLMRVSQDRDDAADLFQETWLRAYRGYPGLEPDSNVRPWLYTIATNVWRNRFRDDARRSRVIVETKSDSAAAEVVGKTHQFNPDSEGYAAVRIRELISELPTKQQQALNLRHFAGLSYEEIAVVMDCSEDSARANVSQAVKKIRAQW